MNKPREPGWLTYGGAGDRYAGAREQLRQAEAHLKTLQGHAADLTELAQAWYRVGRARSYALHLPPGRRFASAHEAMRNAVDIGERVGDIAQRARWWSGLGTALKNLVTDPDDPTAHELNLEEALKAHAKAVELAKESSDHELLAAVLSAAALAYHYRDQGERRDNIDRAVALLTEAIGWRLQLGQHAEAAIAATTCGIVWASHPDSSLGLDRAMSCYDLARRHLNTDHYPAHARRLGRSAGHAALRQGKWDAAAGWYALAWAGVRLAMSRASDAIDRRNELAEYGDASSRHVYALARAGPWLKPLHWLTSTP
ncbi:hypothetical protein [Nocardioides sp. MH1]|uniref:hypothetical protein n=1 Tax=Nocardioides sp. MH1 TaxID=3242490 RepID=UPI00351FE330